MVFCLIAGSTFGRLTDMKILLFLAIVFPFVFIETAAFGAGLEKILLEAEDARLEADRVEVVEQTSFKSGKGVSLKAGAEASVDSAEASPDLVFKVTAPQAGRYLFRTHAAVDAAGRAQMDKAKTKHESMFMKIAVGSSHATKRVVFVPWSRPDSCVQTTGKFDLNGQDQGVRVWLPNGVRLDYLEISPYLPPQVPKAAADYRPKITPPTHHPRLWVNQQSLPEVRANLTKGENARLWKKVQEDAEKPYTFKVEQGSAVDHDAGLETAAVNKAFVYLMTRDATYGRQAVELIRDYLEAVEFGNILDVTREIGGTIYAGARVYDWCYELMTDEDRQSIRLNLMRLADDMEIGWPPFKQGVVNGHGSEAQLHCHLLSMAIAIYDEDPLPYQYCSYRVLEELVPMRNFEYQSPRHHQGIGYGIYRFGWDMHAAWLFYRMTGNKVFDSNIEDVDKYWLYMRLPNKESFPDGDGGTDGRRVNLGATALLTSAYSNDPIMKRDFLQQGGLPSDPILVLLLNDPDLVPADDLTSLPLTLDFGPIRGGMVARTGWDLDKASSDVVVAMTGGGYHFANHQHADAGSFQIYYGGNQVVDLGQYVFYGTPYDLNFNKRSIAHSMMLALDPNEKTSNKKLLNDGGARFGFSSPKSPKDAKTNPVYANGEILSADFGQLPMEPSFSYFSVNLTSAYSNKIKDYVRTFCFLNLHDEKTPGALIILDNMETSGPEIKKYWQVNTLNPPKPTPAGLILSNSDAGQTAKVSLQMLRPAAENRTMEILSGKDANSVFGHELSPSKPGAPQAKGQRVMFSPLKPQKTDVFLTVMTMSEEEQTTLPVDLTETPETFIVSLADRVVVLSKTGELLKNTIKVETHVDGESQLLLTGLKPGVWTIRSQDSKIQYEARVVEKKNTAHFRLPKGQYVIAPNTELPEPPTVALQESKLK